MKRVYKVSGMWEGNVNISNLDEAEPIFTVETAEALYKGNTLNEVMMLWKTSEDNSEVINISRLG